MKNFFLLSALCLLTVTSFAQLRKVEYPLGVKQYKKLFDGPDFVVLEGRKDTIFCNKVEMKMSSNDPVKLKFQVDGRDTILKWKECLTAIAFKTEGAIMQLMPKNPEKPQKGAQHMFISVQGYITVWSNNHQYIDKFKEPKELGRVHNIQYMLVSVDGGPIFIPSMKNYKNQLYPLFKDCNEVGSAGFSDFFAGVLKLCESYNDNCSHKYE